MNKQKIYRWIFSLCLLFASHVLFASVAKNETRVNDDLYSEEKLNIVVSSKKPEFIIRLKSNPTTGYSWFLRDYDKQLIAPLKHRFQVSEEGLMGAPGYEYWHFKVKPEAFIVPSQTIIRMIYARPWQSDVSTQIVFHVSTQK